MPSFEGIWTALITPLKGGTVDLEAVGRLVERQAAAGVNGLVVAATTGEGATLTGAELERLFAAVRDAAGDRLRLVIGASHVSTERGVAALRDGARLGAEAALVAAPAYVRPSQEGMIAYYEALADEGGLPIVLYNVPSRTASDLLPASVGRLARHERIVAIKEATGSIQRAQQVLAAAEGRLDVLSGDDPSTLSILVAGGTGVICTAANVVPERWAALFSAWKGGEIAEASRIQNSLLGLHEALFLEANPGPAKAALHLLGLIEPEIRLPLSWPTEPTIARLRSELAGLGLGSGA